MRVRAETANRESGTGRGGSRPSSHAHAFQGARAGVTATSSPRTRQSGYTLLEVIIAFGLLAAALSLLLGTLTGATRQVRRAADAGTAALHAQSMIDQVGVGAPLEAGEASGEFDEDGRYRWTRRVRPWTEPGPPLPTALVSSSRLYEVVLEVEWGEAADQRLRLQTLRLVETPAGAIQ